MYGNLSVLDTLRNSNQTVLQFGEDNAFEIINELLTLHNEGMEELLSTFVEVTNERMFSFGTSDEMEMRRVDEFGARDTQKVTGGQNLGLPLYLHQIAIGWTKKAFQNMSTGRAVHCRQRRRRSEHQPRDPSGAVHPDKQPHLH
jgi:hypothetical protein